MHCALGGAPGVWAGCAGAKSLSSKDSEGGRGPGPEGQSPRRDKGRPVRSLPPFRCWRWAVVQVHDNAVYIPYRCACPLLLSYTCTCLRHMHVSMRQKVLQTTVLISVSTRVRQQQQQSSSKDNANETL